MKRFTAIISTAALLCSMCACNHSDAPQIPQETVPSGATLEVQMSHSFRSEVILKEEELGYTQFYQFGDSVLTYSPQSDGTAVIGICDPQTQDFVRKAYSDIGNMELCGVYTSEDRAELLMREAGQELYESRYLRYTFDSALNEIGREDETELWGGDRWIISAAMDAQGNEFLAMPNEGILCRKADGTTELLDNTDGNEQLYTGRDGSVYAILDYRTLKRLHPDTLTAEKIPLEMPNNGYLLRGNAAYDVLCFTDEFLYGVILSDGSMQELLHWQESDIPAGTDRRGLLLLPDGRVLLSMTDTPGVPHTLYLMTARTQEEVDSMKLISMATMEDPGSGFYLSKMVSKFNRQAEGCRIVMHSYFDGTAADLGKEALKQDLLDGVVPDILASNPDYHMLSNKGMFEDLSVWMESDPDFQEDEYLMNFFESLKYKGRLERIGFQFLVNSYAAKTAHLDGAQRLTLSDYAELELPEGMDMLNCASRETAFNDLMYAQLSEFVDYENGTCSFDGENFISLLAWFTSFPETAAVLDDYAFQEDRALLYPTLISSLKSYHAVAQILFGNADVTLTGTPVGNSGNGGNFSTMELITVSSSSQYKEEIWEFIKFCLREENQMDGEAFGFPVNRNALAAVMEQDQKQPSETNKSTYSFGNLSEEVTAATAEEAAELMEYLNGITVCGEADDFIYNIVTEETGKCFAGDCTAEDAARVIQSRVSLYLSEQN